MRYLPRLSAAHAREAMGHTFSLWAEGRSLAEHLAYQDEQLTRAGDSLLTYAGLIDDDGALVASLKRFVFDAALDATIVRILGLGAVMVPPELRGRGFGHAVVDRALHEARSAGLGGALLFSEIEPRFYAMHGFQAVERPAWRRTLEAMALPHACEATPTTDPKALSFAPTCARSARLTLTRDPERLVYFAWRNAFRLYVVRREGSAIGYFALGETTRDACELGDLGAVSGEEERVLSVAEAVAESLGARSLTTLCACVRGRRGYTGESRSEEGTPMFASFHAPLDTDVTTSLGALDYF